MGPANPASFKQGLVAVGGDGLFQELVMGLLKQRGPYGAASSGGFKWPPGGAAVAQALQRMRVGHIPGGSTDAVACT